MPTTLWLAAAGDLAVAGVFAYVGMRLGRRHVSAEAQAASMGFMAWWLSISAIWALDAARTGAVAMGIEPGGLAARTLVSLHYATIALLCVGLTGLLAYLAFLYTGRAFVKPIAGFYLSYFAIAAFAVSGARPDAILVGGWGTHVVYAEPLARGEEALFFLFLLVPQLVAAAAYLRLAGHVKTATQRYRIAVVAVTLIVWIGGNLVGDVARWTYVDAWEISRRVLGLVAALAIFAAYQPPASIARRLEARDARLEAVA